MRLQGWLSLCSEPTLYPATSRGAKNASSSIVTPGTALVTALPLPLGGSSALTVFVRFAQISAPRGVLRIGISFPTDHITMEGLFWSLSTISVMSRSDHSSKKM